MCLRKSCLIFFGFVGLLLALALTHLMMKADYFKQIRLLNQDKCRTIDIPQEVEDLEIFKSKYLIGGFDDRVALFVLGGVDDAKNGGLIAWRLDDIENSQHIVPLLKFPEDIKFHAHGMYLEKESHTLFVLNHAHKYGGERVEVFRLEDKNNQVVANYMRSIKITDPNVNGILNDLTVIGDFIYIAQGGTVPKPLEGNDHSALTGLKETFLALFSNAGTIRKCKNTRADNQSEEIGECVEEVSGLLGFGNGITTNGFTKLWVVDNRQRNIAEFNVEYATGKLKLNKRIDIHTIIDNLTYDEETGNIMIATVSRGIDFVNFTNAAKKGEDLSKMTIYSGVSELKFKDGVFEEQEELILQGKISSASVAVPWGKQPNRRIFLGSWHDPKLGICEGL